MKNSFHRFEVDRRGTVRKKKKYTKRENRDGKPVFDAERNVRSRNKIALHRGENRGEKKISP